MNWYKDSILCLNEAADLIQQVEELEKKSIHDIELLDRCKPKIKNCLENCRSPLDFVANFLFDTYCKEIYTPDELKYNRVYYPVTYKRSKLHDNLRKNFKGLNNKKHGVVKLFEQTQPFKENDKWLQHLSSLVNENKHAKLTFNRADKSIDIQHLEFGGFTFNNVTMTNVGVPIKIGDTEYDLINNFPPGSSHRTTAKHKIHFEELDMPVTETLKDIHQGVFNIISAIQEEVKQNPTS